MADNMIELVASLNVDDSAEQINKVDIPKLQKKIEGIKIKCELDTDSITSIQSQLANIKINAPQIDLGVDVRKNQAKALTDALDLTIPRGKTKEVRDTLQGLINDYQRAFQSGNYDEITKSFSALEAYVDQFRKDVQDINKDLVETQQRVKELARSGKTFISENDYNELKYLLDGGKNTNKLLTQAFGLGGWTKDKLKATTSWDSKAQELNSIFDLGRFDSLNDIDSGKFNDHIDGVIQLVNYLNQSFDQGSDFVKEYGAEIDKAFGDQLYTELNRVLGVSTSLDNEFVELFNPDEVKQTAQEVQKLGNEIQGTISKLPDISVGSNTKETLESAKTVLNNYFEASNIDGEANRVKRAIEDTTGELQCFYVQVERGDKSVETLTYAINEQGTAYEYLGKTIREADNSTAFRHEDTSVQWKKQAEDLKAFISNVEKAGVASTVLEQDITNLRTKLAQGGDTSAMNSFLDDFDIAKAKFKSFNAEIRKDNAFANLQSRIKRLTADVNAYASANKRATESTKKMTSGRSFADEWSRITSVMAKGADLTDRELKDLSADMAVFRKEAQAAGLAGESAFDKFLNSFKTMSSYITANMVFNFVKRQLRDMVNEVTAIDTAMTELRKVTEATNAEFEAFAKSAGQTGRELGASISDVINATATFSRAGFNLPDAEELGKVATLYKNVGDGITIDAASESIISVMKAFNIEAENSIGIIDRINEVSNRAAIDSGGLGFALQRVASAMNAANNSLDETIALTTVSNEIVQNPEMVAQGWRTVALRIRGAKSELEDAGLETEGMVESTAKLRDLIKGISGVDIMLDENTFKSTYQIIDELGRVWDKISDIDQASLLEAIAGKRQSNIVAAALNNYERLDEILKISQQSAGSAMREQEEYAKSIQYSIDTLKASYQDLSQTVINSDFVKTLLSGAQEFLEVLTAIIDKFGTFPTLLASIGAVGSFNKMGFFKVVEDDATKGGNAITLFGKKFKDVVKDYKEADAGRIGENKISQALSGIIGFNQSDLSAIEKYNSLIESGVDKTEAFEKSMVGASAGAKSFVQSSKTATVGITGLSISEKAATITTEALGVALNTFLSFGIGLLIQAIITGITKLVDAEKEAQEKAEELRKEATETAKSYKDEVESLSNLTTEYIKLATTTSDLSTQKEKLLDIQDKINDGFASEKEKVDLLNGSLSENLRLLDEQEYKEAKRAISDLEPQYEDFKRQFDYGKQYSFLGSVDKNEAKEVAKNIEQEFIDFFNATTDYYKAEWVDPSTGESRTAYNNILNTLSHADDISIAGQSYAEVLENLDLIIDSYREWEGHNNDTLKSLNALRSKYDELAQSESEVTTAYETAQKSIQDYNDAFNSDASQRISEILEDAKELSTTLNSSTSGTEKYNAIQQLSDLEKEARQLAGTNTVLKNNVDVVFNAINAGSQSSIKSIGDLRSAWFESLEDIQKNTISNIDKMDKALKTVVSGNNLSSSDFWELAKLDTDNIIRSISLVNGEYKLSQQELVNLKDQYIQKQIESLKVTQAQIKADEEEARQALVVAKKKFANIGSFDMAKRGSANLNNPAYRAYLDRQKEANSEIEKAENNIKELGDEWVRNNILLREYNSRLGFSVEQTKALAETYKKNFTDAIDKQIDKVNDRKQALEDEKAVLNEQLEVLEEQQKALEETIEQYKTVSSVIKKAIDEETNALKEQQKAEEDAVQARIDALKKSRETKEEETELAEKQLAVQEKLRDLEKARNNKVRTYSSDRGWHYEADKEAVANAETAYSDARKAYDEFIEKRSYESQLKALESEKDLVSKNYEGMIQAYEDYYTEYEKILNEQTDAENEQLANQILGADWRERIKSRDTDTLNKFKANFNSYNSQLKNLVNNEIATLKNSIKAKDEQIKALDKEIDAWNRYKNNLKSSIDEIDSKYEDMQNGLDGLEYANDLSLSNIESRMWDFKENYKAYMDEAISKARELRDASSEGIDTSAIDNLAERIEKIKGEVNDAIDAMSEKSIFFGGRTSASKTHASLITPQFYDLATPVISNAINKPNVNNANRVININDLTIKTDNPKQFHDQFEKEMGQYWKIKLTENYVK